MGRKNLPMLLGSLCLVIILAVLPFIGACTGAPATAVPIKVGLIVSLTGHTAADGNAIKEGVEFKLDEVNWEIAGRKIELSVADDAEDPVTAVEKAKKLAEVDKVDVILGPLSAAPGMAVASSLTPYGLPNLTLEESDPDILKSGENVFVTSGPLDRTCYPLGIYAYQELGYRTASSLTLDIIGPQGFVKGFEDGFRDSGGSVGKRTLVPLMTMDYGPYLASLKTTDILGFCLGPADTPPFMNQYYTYGLKMPLALCPGSFVNEDVLKEVGDIGIGMLGALIYTPEIDTPTNQKFVQAWETKYGGPPSSFHIMAGYIATTMFLEAVKLTGGDTTHDKIIEALHKVKADTPAGTVSYTAGRWALFDIYVVRVAKIGDRYYWEVVKKYPQFQRP